MYTIYICLSCGSFITERRVFIISSKGRMFSLIAWRISYIAQFYLPMLAGYRWFAVGRKGW